MPAVQVNVSAAPARLSRSWSKHDATRTGRRRHAVLLPHAFEIVQRKLVTGSRPALVAAAARASCGQREHAYAVLVEQAEQQVALAAGSDRAVPASLVAFSSSDGAAPVLLGLGMRRGSRSPAAPARRSLRHASGRSSGPGRPRPGYRCGPARAVEVQLLLVSGQAVAVACSTMPCCSPPSPRRRW